VADARRGAENCLSTTGLFKTIRGWLPKPPSTNYAFRKFDVSPYDLLPPNPVIYDIGAQEARGCYAFGSPPPGAKLVCVDLYPGPGVDIVADAHDLGMVADGTVDCVVAVGVLLHCRFPQQVIDEFFRILKPGGILYINAPFVFVHSEFPDVYYHFTFEGFQVLCRAFEHIQSGFNRGPASSMCHLLIHFCSLLFSFNRNGLYQANLYVFTWLLFWIKYLDAVIGGYDKARLIYSGTYLIGRKPA
jgi:SAM-dependent methyltransferase